MRDNTVVKLDWDRPAFPDLGRIVRLCQRSGYRVCGIGSRPSPGGKGWHLWIVTTPKPKSLQEVVALQAILGSDPWREAVTLYRVNRATTRDLRRMANVLYAPSPARRKG